MDAKINELIGSVDRYNPSNSHLLQAHLLAQLASASYDLAANLALLKLYQFNPPLLETASTLQIIFLAIVNNPFGPDSLLVKALLADTFINGNSLPPHNETDDDDERLPQGEKEIVDKLQELSDALLARKFSTFWETIAALRLDGGDKTQMQVKVGIRELMEVTVGWETKLRGEILAQVQDTFTGIKREVVERFLGLEKNSAALAPLLAAHGDSVSLTKNAAGVDMIRFKENESNTPKAVLQREKIEIEQLSKLLSASQTA